MDSIAKRIKELIDDQGLSNTDFAKETNLNPAIISHILSGRNKPSLQVIQQIKERFTNVNLDYIINGNGQLISDVTNVNSDLSSGYSTGSSGFEGFSMEGVRVVSEPGTKPREAPLENEQKASKLQPDPHSPAFNEEKIEKPSPGQLADKKEVEQIVIFYTDGSFKAYQ